MGSIRGTGIIFRMFDAGLFVCLLNCLLNLLIIKYTKEIFLKPHLFHVFVISRP